ncbi:MAG: metallopeptidase family protein [Nannocystis sp.]|nr:metallopeptidase family protein [Nannocystis sp.]
MADLDQRLAEIDALIADDPRAALAALDALDGHQDDPEVLLLRAHAQWSIGATSDAEELLDALIADDPGFADAHYALARLAEELGDEEAMRRHFLTVLALDAAEERASAPPPEQRARQHQQIAEVAEEALARLPAPLRDRLGNVAIVLEDLPAWEVVATGFDPRALGMFEGPDEHGQRSGEIAVMASRIVLFCANLLATFPDPDELAEEVEVTVLHEIGHYFGLDEDEVSSLGLE